MGQLERSIHESHRADLKAAGRLPLGSEVDTTVIQIGIFLRREFHEVVPIVRGSKTLITD